MIKILRSDKDKTIVLNSETNFGTDLGWEDSFQEFEHETLKEIINPAENFETVRYIHSGYTGQLGVYQHDIWNEFYFVNYSGGTDGGMNYELIGLTPEENSKLLRSENTSFFRLEFYKVPDNENPNSGNRRLVFTKNLPMTMGEKVFYTGINKEVYVPVFVGSNFRNKENMFLYWFEDNSVLDGTEISGNTFYMAAKFYNTLDGTNVSFMNKAKNISEEIDEEQDMYRRVDISRDDYSYVVYTGITTDHRGGESNTSTPLKWYGTSISNISIEVTPTPVVSATPSVTPSISPNITPTPSTSSQFIPSTPTPTPSTSGSGSPPTAVGTCREIYYTATTMDAGVATGNFYLRVITSTTDEWVQLSSLDSYFHGGDDYTGTVCASNISGWVANLGDDSRPQPDGVHTITNTFTSCDSNNSCDTPTP